MILDHLTIRLSDKTDEQKVELFKTRFMLCDYPATAWDRPPKGKELFARTKAILAVDAASDLFDTGKSSYFNRMTK